MNNAYIFGELWLTIQDVKMSENVSDAADLDWLNDVQRPELILPWFSMILPAKAMDFSLQRKAGIRPRSSCNWRLDL